MNKLLALIFLVLTSTELFAQDNIYVCKCNSYETIRISDSNDITFSDDYQRVTIGGSHVYTCSEIDSITFTPPVFAKFLGADISMYPRYQSFGTVYHDVDGNTVNMLDYFGEMSMNAMRVRLFVDPTKDNDKETIQDLDYVMSLARTIIDSGFGFVLDFHYSDTWADPTNQKRPSSWNDVADYGDKLYEYTKDVLRQFVKAGLTPMFIQTGNEISYGLDYSGSSNIMVNYSNIDNSKWSTFCLYLSKASKACREVCPNSKIILHIERTGQPSQAQKFYTFMKDNNVDYDIIGLSYYPHWHGTLTTLGNTLTTLEKSFPEKPIMIMEYGYCYNWWPSNATYSASFIGYECSLDGQQKFTSALMSLLNSHSNVKGFFWWQAEENECPYTGILNNWSNYSLFNNATGNAVPAIKELKSFVE